MSGQQSGDDRPDGMADPSSAVCLVLGCHWPVVRGAGAREAAERHVLETGHRVRVVEWGAGVTLTIREIVAEDHGGE